MSSTAAPTGLPYEEPEPIVEAGPILADEDDTPVRRRVVALLVLALPMFGQTFYYIKDLLPMWSL